MWGRCNRERDRLGHIFPRWQGRETTPPIVVVGSTIQHERHEDLDVDDSNGLGVDSGMLGLVGDEGGGVIGGGVTKASSRTRSRSSCCSRTWSSTSILAMGDGTKDEWRINDSRKAPGAAVRWWAGTLARWQVGALQWLTCACGYVRLSHDS
jgi:hypothetical protein